MKHSTILASLLSMLLGLLAVCFASVVYFAYFEPPFLSYVGLPFIVQGGTQHPGDNIQLQVYRCSLAPHTRTYTISHSLINASTGVKTNLPAETVQIDPGCHSGISAANRIPIGTVPGTYVVDGFAEVEGTLRTFSIHYYSVPFQIG